MSDMRRTSIVAVVQEKLFLTVLFFDSLERLPVGRVHINHTWLHVECSFIKRSQGYNWHQHHRRYQHHHSWMFGASCGRFLSLQQQLGLSRRPPRTSSSSPWSSSSSSPASSSPSSPSQNTRGVVRELSISSFDQSVSQWVSSVQEIICSPSEKQ